MGLASNPRGRSSGRRLGFWVGVALLVHAEVIGVIAVAFYLYAPRNADLQQALAARGGEQESIDVGMLDEAAARQIVAELEKQDEARKAEEEKKEVESVHPPGQVVDLPTPLEEKRPDSAKFVSEHDSTVTHETKKFGRFEDKSARGRARGRRRCRRSRAPPAATTGGSPCARPGSTSICARPGCRRR